MDELTLPVEESRDSRAKSPKVSDELLTQEKVREVWTVYVPKKPHDKRDEDAWYEIITSVTFVIDAICKKATYARSTLQFRSSIVNIIFIFRDNILSLSYP